MKYKYRPGHKNLNLIKWIMIVLLCSVTLLFMQACTKTNDSKAVNTTQNPDKIIANCKETPKQLVYGKTTFDLSYDQQGNLVKLTCTKPVSIKQPSSAVSTTYTIQYDKGKTVRISKTIDLKASGYFIPEYNSTGEIIKLGEYTDQGQRNYLYTAEFDGNGNISRIITNTDGNAVPQTCRYTYSAGNLVKRSVQHFYDPVSKEFIDAEFTYDYYLEKEKKDKVWFTGLLGLRIMADFADSESLFYIPNAERGQLLFVQEGTGSKNMLKHIKATAHRYGTTDDTDVNYTYNYDADGVVNLQKGNSSNIIIRSEPSPFGGTVNVTIPTNYSSEISVAYICR